MSFSIAVSGSRRRRRRTRRAIASSRFESSASSAAAFCARSSGVGPSVSVWRTAFGARDARTEDFFGPDALVSVGFHVGHACGPFVLVGGASGQFPLGAVGHATVLGCCAEAPELMPWPPNGDGGCDCGHSLPEDGGRESWNAAGAEGAHAEDGAGGACVHGDGAGTSGTGCSGSLHAAASASVTGGAAHCGSGAALGMCAAAARAARGGGAAASGGEAGAAPVATLS